MLDAFKYFVRSNSHYVTVMLIVARRRGRAKTGYKPNLSK